jgi:hypothetical protein
MKYWFFSLLLANAIFFLWEFHYGALEPPKTPDTTMAGGEKQILLLSEAGSNSLSQRPESARLVPEVFASVMEISNALLQDAQQPLVKAAEPETAGQAPVLEQAASENNASTEAVEEISTNPAPPQIAEQPETEQAADELGPENGIPPEPASPPKPEAMHTSCYAAGRSINVEALNNLLGRYRPQLTALELTVREKRKNGSYLVYYPPAATLEQSIATAETLRNNYGVSDLLVFRNGELKGTISLGVFSNEQRAKIAQSQLEKKGVHAKIMPRYPLEKNYFVRARWSEQQTAAAKQLSDALKKNYPAMGRTASVCDG